MSSDIPRCCCLSHRPGAGDAPAGAPVLDPAEAFFYDDTAAGTGGWNECAGVLLQSGDEARARALLDAGARRVLVGEAALRDAEIVTRLARACGAARVGVHVAVRPMDIGWSFETSSNADFKVVAPSRCEPAWEVLQADGRPSGTAAHWWLARMAECGASCFLVQADIRDAADLNLCAGLVEELGERLWIGPLTDAQPPLADWVAYGRVRNIVLPAPLHARRSALIAVGEQRAA